MQILFDKANRFGRERRLAGIGGLIPQALYDFGRAAQADKRAAALDRAMADIVTSFNALRAAEARKEQGIEPQEGERQGRRYRPEYWQRQQELQRDIDEARARLNDALERRNALR